MLMSNTAVLFLIPTILAFPLDSDGSNGLVSDLGISSINDVNIENIGTILDLMIKSGGSVKNVIDKFSNLSNLEVVEELVKESEEIITRLQQGVSEINEKHRSFAGEALKDMIYIKLQLKTSRISLNDLAQRTVFAVADLKAFSEAFFADDTEEIADFANVVDLRNADERNADKIEYVKEQMTVMMNLIKDTNSKINEVRAIYAEIREKMSSVEETLVQYKLMVEHLLKNETSGGANYQVYARSGVYTSAGISTTACIVADILGAMGFCSLINAAAVTGSTITLEVALANMRANLETLKKDGELAISDVQELMATQDEVEEYLYNEEQTLVFWAAALQLLERKVEDTDRLFLKAPRIVKERYLNSLDELQRAAQNYLDQEEL
jgi:hypothetical protein